MIRIIASLLSLTLLLSACTTSSGGGGTTATIFRINARNAAKIQFRMLDTVNAIRKATGAEAVELSAELNAASATHSRDMSLQNRPWHFGSDGSSPIDRVARAGFTGTMLGENISESFENDVETLAAWLELPDTKAVILDPNAKFMGISWHQEDNGKIWWTQIFGR